MDSVLSVPYFLYLLIYMAFMPWSLAYYELLPLQGPGQRQPLALRRRRVKGDGGAAAHGGGGKRTGIGQRR